MKENQKNILLLWDRMGDYHRARWVALGRLYNKGKVFAADLGRGDNLYQWNSTDEKENFAILSKKKVTEKDSFKRLLNYISLVKKNNIGAVAVAGYGKISYLLIIIASKLMGREVLIFAESWYPGNPITDRIKAWFVNAFCNHVFVSGKKAEDFFTKRFKYPIRKIISGYSVVDNAHFAQSLPSAKKEKILLCVARFSKEKNLMNLIEAFEQSNLPKNNWQLVIVGGGPQKDQLKKAIIGENVTLKNWVSYDQLPELYQRASCFILPSTFEPWGLVVNEAMAAGLPVIVSEQSGCAPDLVNNKNGWFFNTEKQGELLNLLNKLSDIPHSLLLKMGKDAQQIIRNFTPEIWAEKILNAFN